VIDEKTVAEAVTAWAGDLLEIPEAQRHPHPISLVQNQMPDLVATVLRRRVVRGDPAFPYSQLEQAWLLLFDVEVSVKVDREDVDPAIKAAHQTLQGYGKALSESAHADATLGGRVEFVSPAVECDYSAVFEEYEDGTRAQVVIVTLTVGELIDEPE
jgi:hypothetical protein